MFINYSSCASHLGHSISNSYSSLGYFFDIHVYFLYILHIIGGTFSYLNIFGAIYKYIQYVEYIK